MNNPLKSAVGDAESDRELTDRDVALKHDLKDRLLAVASISGPARESRCTRDCLSDPNPEGQKTRNTTECREGLSSSTALSGRVARDFHVRFVAASALRQELRRSRVGRYGSGGRAPY